MVYHGKFHNGQIILDGGTRLPEGTDVQVEPVLRSNPTRGTIEAVLATGARWQGSDEEMNALLTGIRDAKSDEVRGQLRKREPEL